MSAATGTAYDVLVLGGGSAGCVLAARLSQDPRRTVCLIEAGPDYGPFGSGRWPAELLDANFDATGSHDWGFEGGLSSSRARLIGGCSSHNGCGIIWPSPGDIDEWDAAGAVGWTYESLVPHLRRAAATLRARPSTIEELEPFRRAFLEGAQAVGATLLAVVEAPDALEGVGMIAVNAVGSIRWNAAFAYLDVARDRPNLTILADTLADRISFEGSRAVGARVIRDGRPIDVRAGTVIVAAGAFASPAILQRSGIGAAAELKALGIEPLVDRPGVGRSMANHPYAALMFEPTRAYKASGLATAAREVGQVQLRHRVAGGASDAWDLLLCAWCTPAPDESSRPTGPLVAGIMATITKPASTGWVAIRSADPATLPAIHHNFLGDAGGGDLERLAEGLRLARRISRTKPFARLVERELDPGSDVGDADLGPWAATSVFGDYHPCGTCRMGAADDPLAVVGPDGAVLGTEGLFVVDASIFPTIPRVNIHLTVVGAAERFAELLART